MGRKRPLTAERQLALEKERFRRRLIEGGPPQASVAPVDWGGPAPKPGSSSSLSWSPFTSPSGTATTLVVDPMTESIIRWLMEIVNTPGSPIEYLREPQFEPVIERWARAEARRMRGEAKMLRLGEFDDEGNPRRLMNALFEWEKRCGYLAERLGLDPLALAKIRHELAELHKDTQAITAISELQEAYRQKRPPEVLEGHAG